MSSAEVRAIIAQLSLDATRVAFANGQATIYDLARAVRRASTTKGK